MGKEAEEHNRKERKVRKEEGRFTPPSQRDVASFALFAVHHLESVESAQSVWALAFCVWLRPTAAPGQFVFIRGSKKSIKQKRKPLIPNPAHFLTMAAKKNAEMPAVTG